MAREAAEKPPEEILSLWKREQAQLKALLVEQDTEAWQRDPAFSGLQRVGGVDLSFVKGDSASACASLVVLSYPELEVVYEDCSMVNLTAPYMSGFLAFREVPFLVDAVQRLQEKEPHMVPQVLFVDGNGVLHHRGFGVACHLGILTDLPCIGVAKKLLQVDGLENNAQHKEKIRLLQAEGDTFPLIGGSGTVLGMVSGQRPAPQGGGTHKHAGTCSCAPDPVHLPLPLQPTQGVPSAFNPRTTTLSCAERTSGLHLLICHLSWSPQGLSLLCSDFAFLVLGPEEPQPQQQAPLRLRGPQDKPGVCCTPDPKLLQVPEPGARAPG
uniref:Endonuclease V n=1 Tax=Canis lupus dingo TaxID=286419 RepID=A0A8C0K6N1_CANLU